MTNHIVEKDFNGVIKRYYANSIPTEKCLGTFCEHSSTCEHLVSRECPYLKVIDRCHLFEQLCEKYGIDEMDLDYILKYINSIGGIDAIRE